MSSVIDKTKNMFGAIGAMQTLVEKFPMNFFSLDDLNFSTSFDVLGILFKLFGVDREELVRVITNALCGGMKEDTEGTGFIAQVEEIVKMALEANIMNLLNCSTNFIISNDLIDSTDGGYKDYDSSGEGITLNVAEIDFTGVLNRNPFLDDGAKFYFDIEGKKPNDLYKSKDFNAFLWYIINKSDKSQDKERVWDNRYRAAIYGKGNGKHKEIIRCTYIDEEYPNTDKLKIQLCGSNYYKTRHFSIKNKSWSVNKTILEFNHEFLSSIKLYEPKVIIAEIVEYLMGSANFTVNLGFSVNEEIIQGKIQEIIRKVIGSSDTEINDCFFSFSNDEFNDMLEKSEQNRYNIVNNGSGFVETDPSKVLDRLTGITMSSTLVEDKTVISETLNDLIVKPAQDPSGTVSYGLGADWSFNFLQMLVYPFIRPLFTPKVIFLLLVNKKIMGSLEDIENINVDEIVENLINGLFYIIKDIIIKLKDMLVDMLMELIMEKIKPLLELFASRLLMETLKMYKDLLEQLLEACLIGWQNNKLVGVIDNVNYADIIPTQTEPNQSSC